MLYYNCCSDDWIQREDCPQYVDSTSEECENGHFIGSEVCINMYGLIVALSLS